MKYYKYVDETSNLGTSQRYVEADDGVSVREVEQNELGRTASNFKDEYGQLLISHGRVDYDDIDEVTPISRDEFEQVWTENLAARASLWQSIKQAWPIGALIDAYIQQFCYHGVIVYLGSEQLGIANYRECRDASLAEHMYAHQRFTGIVTGYDEINQWVQIGQPQAHAQARAESRYP